VKALRPLAVLLLLAAAPAAAQSAPVTSRPWLPLPPPPQGQGMNGTVNGGVIFVEREYVPVVEREVVREVTVAEPPAAAPPPPRKPYVIGRNYSSLPGPCMKIIEDGASYFYCSGEWYRQVGAGQYRAVARP